MFGAFAELADGETGLAWAGVGAAEDVAGEVRERCDVVAEEVGADGLGQGRRSSLSGLLPLAIPDPLDCVASSSPYRCGALTWTTRRGEVQDLVTASVARCFHCDLQSGLLDFSCPVCRIADCKRRDSLDRRYDHGCSKLANLFWMSRCGTDQAGEAFREPATARCVMLDQDRVTECSGQEPDPHLRFVEAGSVCRECPEGDGAKRGRGVFCFRFEFVGSRLRPMVQHIPGVEQKGFLVRERVEDQPGRATGFRRDRSEREPLRAEFGEGVEHGFRQARSLRVLILVSRHLVMVTSVTVTSVTERKIVRWTISTIPYDHPDADALRAAQRRELDERYGSDDHEPGTPPSAADVPVFLVARDEAGTPIACGGLRPLPEAVLGRDVAEIKRMFAAPAARGTGAAVAVLRALEAAAAELGLARLVLETGALQPDAIRFYEREGYEPMPLFGTYVGSDRSLCFTRTLVNARS